MLFLFEIHFESMTYICLIKINNLKFLYFKFITKIYGYYLTCMDGIDVNQTVSDFEDNKNIEILNFFEILRITSMLGSLRWSDKGCCHASCVLSSRKRDKKRKSKNVTFHFE